MEQFKNVHSYVHPEIKFTKTKVRIPSNIRDGKDFDRQRLEDNINKQLEEKREQELQQLMMLINLTEEEIAERMAQFDIELEKERQALMQQIEDQMEEIYNKHGESFVYDEIVYDLPEYMKIQNEIIMNMNAAIDATMFGLDDVATLQVEENEALDATMLALDEIIIANEEIIANLQGQLESANSEIVELKNNMAILADKIVALEEQNNKEGEEE